MPPRPSLLSVCVPGILRERGGEWPGSGQVWLTIADVQATVSSGMEAMNIAQNAAGKRQSHVHHRSLACTKRQQHHPSQINRRDGQTDLWGPGNGYLLHAGYAVHEHA